MNDVIAWRLFKVVNLDLIGLTLGLIMMFDEFLCLIMLTDDYLAMMTVRQIDWLENSAPGYHVNKYVRWIFMFDNIDWWLSSNYDCVLT